MILYREWPAQRCRHRVADDMRGKNARQRTLECSRHRRRQLSHAAPSGETTMIAHQRALSFTMRAGRLHDESASRLVARPLTGYRRGAMQHAAPSAAAMLF